MEAILYYTLLSQAVSHLQSLVSNSPHALTTGQRLLEINSSFLAQLPGTSWRTWQTAVCEQLDITVNYMDQLIKAAMVNAFAEQLVEGRRSPFGACSLLWHSISFMHLLLYAKEMGQPHRPMRLMRLVRLGRLGRTKLFWSTV
jgi:hypothetical protein